ncbi:farnesol dehydrogenase-like [Culicoides brevitarsis]|uniref:farnesol dehydrogenase-like n=1 Tax=Culicoides brevitarsis TaxID=469753 RepID=UPI00307C2F71
MENWRGKVAVVTGSSAGIGAAICEALARHGVHVVGMARRTDRTAALAEKCKSFPGKIHAVECDVTSSESINKAFDWVSKKFGGVDILVNNAGTYRKGNFLDLEIPDEKFTLTFETNVTGLLLCTRRAYKLMLNRPMGYIININSVAGHMSANALPPTFGLNIYGASKHAVTQITEVVRMELASMGNHKIRISSVSPGAIETEIHLAAEIGENIWEKMQVLQPSDVADQCIYLLSTKPNVHVSELTIKPAGEKF